MEKRRAMAAAAIFLSVFALAGCGPGQPFGPTLTPTPSNTPTPTETPTITPTPTPLQGTVYYLRFDWTLGTTPPNYGQADFWCNSCAPIDLSTYTWSLTLAEKTTADYYRYAVVSSDAVANIRIRYSHGGRDILLAAWNGNINQTDEEPGVGMEAVAGDVLTVEIDVRGNTRFWIEDDPDYSSVTLIQS